MRSAFTLLLLLPLPLAAAGTNLLPRVIVSAPEVVRRPGTLITRDEIRQSGARSVADLLETREGIQIERYGGSGQPAAIRIRGGSPAQVLILLDDVPLNPSLGGGTDLNTLDLDNIASIEIIRGAVAAAMGQGAFSGVIHIRTRAPRETKKPAGSLSLSGGSFRSLGAGGRVLLPGNGRLRPALEVHGGYQESAGGYLFPGQPALSPSGEFTLGGSPVKHRNTGYSSGTAGLSLGWGTATDPLGFTLSLNCTARDAGVPGTIDFPTVDAAQKDNRILVTAETALRRPGMLPGDSLLLRLFFLHQQRWYRDFSLFDTESNHRMTHPGALLRYQGRAGRILLHGDLSLDHEVLDSTVFPETLARTAASARLGMELPLGKKLTVQGDLRGDLSSAFPAALSPGVGAIWSILPDGVLTLHARAGSACRLPSFSDLFWPDTFFAAGNPDLRPERARTVDLGLAARLRHRLTLELTLFHNRITDLIRWEPSAGGVWRPSNLGRARITGLEAAAVWQRQLGSQLLQFSANYTLQHAEDRSGGVNDGRQLPRTPFEKAALAAALTSGRGWFFRAEGSYLGFRYLNAANTKYLGDCFLVNLATGMRLRNGLFLRGSIRNLFDTAYIHLREYPVPGREFLVESGLEF